MFGIGKKRVQLGQFCRLVQLRIFEKRPLDADYLDKENVLTEHEHKILNADLFTFRFIVFSLLLSRTSIMKKSKRTSYDLGYISSHSLKLALQDKGYTQEHLDEFEGIYFKEMDYQMELITNREWTDIELLESVAAIGFTKYFGDLFGFATPTKENGKLQIDNYKEAITMHIAIYVFKVVEQIYQEEIERYKIVDL